MRFTAAHYGDPFLGKIAYPRSRPTFAITQTPPTPTPVAPVVKSAIPPRYEFIGSGVGCGGDGPTCGVECLCDVDLTRYPVTPLVHPPGAVLYSRLAADLCIKEFDKITWEGWAGWLCAITDEAAKRKFSALVSTVAECKAETENPKFSGDTRSVLRRAYPTLLAAGYDTEHCANILNTTTQALFALIAPVGGTLARLGLEGFLLLEFMLKDGSLSTREMAKESGTTPEVVRGHAARMGITPPPGIKGRAQQPHVLACMKKWTDAGLSCRKVVAKVLEETGVKVSPQHVLRRKTAA